MKKLTCTILAALAVILTGVGLVFASGENVVISLSYLNGTYMEQLTARLSKLTEGLDRVYAAAADKLEERLGEEIVDLSWNETDMFQSVYPRSGETVTLSTGSGLMWYSGTGAASSVLIDVTTGEELAPGGSLTAGHRYLAEQETVVTAVSTSSCAAEGRWKTTATGTAPIQLKFKDVAIGDWYYDAVLWAVESNVTTGTGDGTTFSPNDDCTRGQIVTFLWRAAGCPEPIGKVNPFTDISTNAYYYKAVLWAVENGITTGTDDGTTFSPEADCTRGQIVTFLWRAAGTPEPKTIICPFTDVSADGYYYKAVLWAVENGVTTGTGDGTTFSPNADCTRAQIVTFLYRYFA